MSDEGRAAHRALDEPRKEIAAVGWTSTLALILGEAGVCLLLELCGDHGQALPLHAALAARDPYPVRPAVGAQVDQLAEGTGTPPRRVLARPPPVLPAGAGHPEVVEPLRLLVEGGAPGDVGEDLAIDGRFLLHDYEAAVLGDV